MKETTGSVTYAIPNSIGNPGITAMPAYSSTKLPAPYVIPAQAETQTTLTPCLPFGASELESFSRVNGNDVLI
jgi:hypothetical protein